MGNLCGTNVYDEIKSKYPNELLSMLTANKIQSGLGDQFSGLQNQLTSAISGVKSDSIGKIDQNQNQVISQFNDIKSKLNAAPGGVAKIEQANGAKLEDMLGFNNVMKQFGEMKGDVLNKFSSE